MDGATDPMAQFLARLRTDDDLRRQVREHPRPTLAAHGIVFPEGVEEIRVVEATDRVAYFTLPPRAGAGGELSDATLTAVAGGGLFVLRYLH